MTLLPFSFLEPPAAGPAAPWWTAALADAAARLAGASLPTDAEEVWRYSRIVDLDPEAFPPAPPPTSPNVAMATDLLAPHADAIVVAVVDGHVVGVNGRLPAGLVVGPLSAHPDGEAFWAAARIDAVDVFAELTAARSADPLVIDVARGARIDQPVVVLTHAATGRHASFPHLLVRVGDDAAVTVLGHHTAVDEPVLVVPRTDTVVGVGARLAHGVVQTLPPTAWSIANTVVRVASSATAAMGVAALGGGNARIRTDCRLEGRGARGDLSALYYGRGDQMHDVRTFQNHVGRDTRSDLLFKGVLDDRARSVYTGLIRIRPEARGSEALQTNRNLKLSDDAWAESVPNLEIETRDVRCSHASTVSPLDPEQLFYLASRGVPPEIAARLIVAGFFDDVIDRFPVAAARDRLRSLVDSAVVRSVDEHVHELEVVA